MSSSLSHNLQLYLGNLYSLPRKDMQFLQQICVSSCISTWEESQGDTTIGNTHPGGIRAEQLAPFNLKEAGVLLKAPFGRLSLSPCPFFWYSGTQFFRSDARKADHQVNWETIQSTIQPQTLILTSGRCRGRWSPKLFGHPTSTSEEVYWCL